jgi:hypothetical protein
VLLEVGAVEFMDLEFHQLQLQVVQEASVAVVAVE